MNINGIDLLLSVIQARSSLELRNSSMTPYVEVLEKRQQSRGQSKINTKKAVKAMNETKHKNGLVATRLVSKLIQGFVVVGAGITVEKEKIQVLGTADTKVNTIITQKEIMTVLTGHVFSVGNRVSKTERR